MVREGHVSCGSVEYVETKIAYITRHALAANHNDTMQISKKVKLAEESKVKRGSVLCVCAVIKSYFNPLVFAIGVTSMDKAMKNL